MNNFLRWSNEKFGKWKTSLEVICINISKHHFKSLDPLIFAMLQPQSITKSCITTLFSLMSFLPCKFHERRRTLTSIKLSPILSFVTISPVYGSHFLVRDSFPLKQSQGNNQMNENASGAIFCWWFISSTSFYFLRGVVGKCRSRAAMMLMIEQ